MGSVPKAHHRLSLQLTKGREERKVMCQRHIIASVFHHYIDLSRDLQCIHP